MSEEKGGTGMEDLAEKLNELLRDPETMQQVQALAGMLGQSNGEEKKESSPRKGAEEEPSGSPEMFRMLTQVMPLLSQMNREDDNTRFLQALRPLLKEDRQQRLDQAVKFLQMLTILPYLREMGIF